mgnify:CR=1 FL=1
MNEKFYKWAIIANDGVLDSQQSEIWSFTTEIKNAPPGKASLIYPINKEVIRQTSLNLQWEATDADGDELEFDVREV